MFSLFNFCSIFPEGSADLICPYVRTPMELGGILLPALRRPRLLRARRAPLRRISPYQLVLISISQVTGCEDRLRNDLYCVEWGVKLYSIQPTNSTNSCV